MEPDESCTILCGETGKHAIEGIADGFIPGIFARHRRMVDEMMTVESDEALQVMKSLAKEHGMFVGPSSGAHLVAAQRFRVSNPQLACVVTMFCDEGEKYLSEYWELD